MKRTCSVFLIMLVNQLIFSQDRIFVLHPFIGDTIDNYEKNRFLLFPEMSDSSFFFGQIHHLSDNNYLLYAYSDYKAIPRISKIDSLTIKEYYLNIQKFIDYYKVLLKSPDSVHKPLNAYKENNLKVNLNISPEFYKKLSSDVDRYQFLKWNAQERGLWGREIEDYIKTSGFFTIPSKKNK